MANSETATRDDYSLKAKQLGVEVKDFESKEKIMDNIYKKICRPKLIQPVFIIDYPAGASPLAKRKEGNKNLIDRFQLVAGGYELTNSFSELNDPIDQKERFKEQDKAKEMGEEEISPSDEDYLEAMEYGMPPAAGSGLGIDRLVMLLTNTHNIKEVILFPTMSPKFMNSNEILISLVLPIHNEEGNIPELYARSKKVLGNIGGHEIIFVNDGSQDISLKKLLEICDKDKSVKVIDFSRNFGHQMAITAGISHATGQTVVVMDSDLQDPPEIISDLFAKWRDGFEVVHAKRKTRQDGIVKKITAFIFYRIMRRLANVDIMEDAGDFYLMDRRAVDAMKEIGESSVLCEG